MVQHSNCCIVTFQIVVIGYIRIAATSEGNAKTWQKAPSSVKSG